jgi:RNA polymerase sigma factor (sigma-70 family)
VLSEARAEDASQQVFMSAWLALRRGDDVLNLRGWLLMIARNTALNALRVPGYDYAELQESLRMSEVPQDEVERRDVMRQTLTGLAALPDRQREALLRSAVEGSSHADIARDMGLTEGATRQLVLRARTTMRAAATALTPWPVVSWLATRGGGDSVQRLVEAAVAGGGAGTAALLAKAGVVAVVAGGAIAGPGVMVQRSEEAATAAKAATPHKPRPSRRGAVRPVLVAAPAAAPVVLRISDIDGSRRTARPSAASAREPGERGARRTGRPDRERREGHGHHRAASSDDRGDRAGQSTGHSGSPADHGDEVGSRRSPGHDESSVDASDDSGGRDASRSKGSSERHGDGGDANAVASGAAPVPAQTPEPELDQASDSPEPGPSSGHGSVAGVALSDDASSD